MIWFQKQKRVGVPKQSAHVQHVQNVPQKQPLQKKLLVSLKKRKALFSFLLFRSCYLYRRIFFLPSTRTGRPLNDNELFVVEEVVVFLLIQEQLAVIIHVYRDGGD